MNFIDRNTAISKMNKLGSEKKSFLFIIDYRQEHIYIETTDNSTESFLLYDFNGKCNFTSSKTYSVKIEMNIFPQTAEDYNKSFSTVMRHICTGNSYLVNLTCSTPIKLNISLKELFFRVKAMYKLYIPGKFIVFSPEIFVRMNNGFVYSYPMKGTINADLPNAEHQIISDPKEAAEHATIVDLIRNDLSMISTEVCVPKFRYIDEVQTNKGKLLQVSSEVRGKLPENWNEQIGTMLFSLLPAGSITGAPKKKTQEIISEAETYERGFYTGVMGYYDGEKLDSAVMIRYIEQQEEKLFFKSGGGITYMSEMESEYEEMIQKIYVPVY